MVLSQVQHALRGVHTAVGLHATLTAIAVGVTTSTPYQEVAVTIAEDPDATEMRVIVVIGSPGSQAALLGTTCERAAMQEHIAGGEAWGALRFRAGLETPEGILTFIPDYEPLDGPDAWRPDYELVAPLYGADGELIGMLSLDEPRGGRIPPRWANEILELFAEQAVIAITNARRHEQSLRAMETLEREKAELDAAVAAQHARESELRREALGDALTGLANRVLLRERLESLLAAQTPVAVVFCDLDRFKQINDTYGHAVGDEVLRQTGRRLARDLADVDVVARIGGDEFVVVAAGVTEADAPLLLERIEQAFTGVGVPGVGVPGVGMSGVGVPVPAAGLNLRVTASLGLVCEPGRTETALPSPAQRVEELLRRADREMYAHKRSRAGVDRLRGLTEVRELGQGEIKGQAPTEAVR